MQVATVFYFKRLRCFIYFSTRFPLWGEWILGAKRVKDERGRVRQEYCEHQTSFTLITSIGLTSISFRQTTLPTERAPFVASRHFPRFIGEIHPKGESKSGLVLRGYEKRVYPKEEEYHLFNEMVAGRFFSCRKVFLNFVENRLTNFFLGI